MKCRICQTLLENPMLDLSPMPLVNEYWDRPDQGGDLYPLQVFFCSECSLLQIGEAPVPEKIFQQYAYQSSLSQTWLEHIQQFRNQITKLIDLKSDSLVVEIASNDGCLLKSFHELEIPVLGIEPASNLAKLARLDGIPTENYFFTESSARDVKQKGKTADLLVANNVLAHVPDILGFLKGIREVLKPQGICTLEFPHLLKIVQKNQFDTIYHEHIFYLSLISVQKLFTQVGLRLFHVEEILTHGGSLRIYGTPEKNDRQVNRLDVEQVMEKERQFGLNKIETYKCFAVRVKNIQNKLMATLKEIKQKGQKIVCYGAPAKGTVLLNYCGVPQDWIEFAVDRSSIKQGKYLPGVGIPIKPPEKILDTKPDYLWILPWNLKDEIISQNHFIREWGGKFLITIPEIEIIS